MPPQTSKSKSLESSDSVKESDAEEITDDNLLLLLRTRLQYWKQVLRVQDWNVSLDVLRKHEMADPNSIGCIRIFEEGKDAKIQLLSPVDLVTVEDSFIDHEELNYDITLVHELLHIHFQPFAEDDSTYKGIVQEQVINTLSRAIVQAYQVQALLVPKETETVKSKDAGHYL